MAPGAPEAAIAAIHAASPILTKPANGGSISSWLTFASIVSACIMAYFVFYPKLRAVTNARLNSLDDERRDDMAKMREENAELRKEMGALRERVAVAVKAASEADSRSSILRAIVSMMIADAERRDSDNPVITQARAMIEDLSRGDLGLGKGMRDIAQKVVELK